MAIFVTMLFSACTETSSSSSSPIIEFNYELDRKYTGTTTNSLNIEVTGGASADFEFSIANTSATSDVELDSYQALESGAVNFTYANEGVYSADFKIRDKNGIPFVFEVMTWEYSTERPDPPVISFAASATKYLTNSLVVSDSRTANTDAIWISGDVDTTGKTIEADGGYWEDLDLETSAVGVTLSAGEGLKTIRARFRNIFGNESEEAVPAEIIVKQTAATNCTAEPLSTTIANNKLSLKLNATDPYQMYYSATGSLGAPVSQKEFDDDEVVFVYVEPSPGSKTVNIYIDDIAGNRCLEKTMTIVLDPDYESEGIWVQNKTYWTDDENVTLDIFFDHYPSQEPLELKITGDIVGSNINSWIPYAQGLPATLTPTTSGSRRIYAQYRDKDGTLSYLISKTIFLKPTITFVPGAPDTVVVSNIAGAETLTITGCTETYTDVAWQATFTCSGSPVAGSVTYTFEDATTLTKNWP